MRMVLVLTAVMAASCGGSGEGSACPTADAVECSSATRMLVCEGAKWQGYACPSCTGGKCDWKGAKTGDGCPKVAETWGTCNYDGRLVGCFWSASADAGVFVESACAACVAGKSIDELGRCGTGRCTCQ